MRITSRSVPVLLLLLALVPGCGRKQADANVLRYAMIEEPKSIDPALNESADTGEALQNVYEGLVRFDAKMQLVPWLADSWELSADKRTYTFHLNPRAKFHAPFSRQVTAADVKWSIERALRPETKSPIIPSLFLDVEGSKAVVEGKARECSGVRAVDTTTLTVTTLRPCSYFLQELGAAIVVCREAIEKTGGKITLQSAIGTGPYLLKEFRSGSHMVLEANPEYYRGAPKLARIVRPIVLDHQTAHIQYENGETELCQESFPDYLADRNNAKLKDQCLLMPWSGTNYVVMHPTAEPAFKDRNVRRAFAEAIDRDRIIRIVYQNAVLKAEGFLPPGICGHDDKIRGIPYDPSDAQKLLAKAGYAGGKGFPHIVLQFVQQNPEVASTAQIIRDCLRENLGVEVELKAREAATFYADTGQNKVGFYTIGWIAADPHDSLSLQFRTGARYNTLAYSSPKFDAAVDRGDGEFDPTKRAAAYAEADQIQLDDVATLPLDHMRVPYLVKPTVHDLEYNLTGLMPHMRVRVGH